MKSKGTHSLGPSVTREKTSATPEDIGYAEQVLTGAGFTLDRLPDGFVFIHNPVNGQAFPMSWERAYRLAKMVARAATVTGNLRFTVEA